MSNINVFLFCQLGKEGLIKNIMPTVACLTATYVIFCWVNISASSISFPHIAREFGF